MPLTHLTKGKTARIVEIRGGHGLRNKLQIMGLNEGKRVKIISKQPLTGPITISIYNCQLTIGRGMAHKIIVEEI